MSKYALAWGRRLPFNDAQLPGEELPTYMPWPLNQARDLGNMWFPIINKGK